jgi:hypothetical protein
MKGHIPAHLVRLVRQRARNVCEYCLLPQESQDATFHVDHIHPASAEGETVADNLALACVTCSLRKAARIRGRDPLTKQLVPLFHPRRDRWPEHFAWASGWRLFGLTPQGRATIAALGMNRPSLIAIRRTLAALGRFPPRANGSRHGR